METATVDPASLQYVMSLVVLGGMFCLLLFAFVLGSPGAGDRKVEVRRMSLVDTPPEPCARADAGPSVEEMIDTINAGNAMRDQELS